MSSSISFGNFQFFNGKLDDIRIYNRPLNQSEITALYQEGGYSSLNQGLVAYYPFNGNANDESGNGNNGTLSGTPSFDTGKIGEAIQLTSQQQYIGSDGDHVIIPMLDFNNFTEFTINMWVNQIASYNDGESYISYGSASDGWIGIIQSGSYLSFGIGVDGMNYTYDTNDNNNWVMYTLRFENDSMFGYRNGILKCSNSATLSVVDNTAAIARHWWWSGTTSTRFSGSIDEVRVYNRAITDQEIQALYGGEQANIATITVDAPSTIPQNDTVEISINTSDLQASDGIISYQFKLAYDDTRLSYLSNNLVGTIDNGGTVNINSGTAGLLNIGYMTSTALEGAGSILKLKFIVTTTLGDAIFTLSDFLYNTTAITDLQNDTITVIDGISPTGAVTYSVNPAIVREGDALQITVTFDEAMADAPVPQISLSGENTLANTDLTKVSSTVYTYDYVVQHGNGNVFISLATGTDIAGNLLVATPASGEFFTVLPAIYGDIDP